MAEQKKSIEISYKANISDLKKKLEQLPDITADEAKKMVSALDRQLKQAERAAKKSAEASQKAARASAKAAKQGAADFSKLASSAAVVGAAFTAMGAGVLSFSQDLADLTNQLTDASAKSGIAIETLAGLRLAAEGSGLSFENLEGGLIRFQTSMDNASKGSKTFADSFKTLGVEVKDAGGQLRSADDVFNEAVTALGQMENITERNAIAMRLFGREGGAGLIQSGALENLENMKAFAKEFGVSIDEDAIGAMGNFQRKMAEFDTVAQGTFQRLLESVSGKNSVAIGIDAASKAMIFFGSIAQDTLAFASQGFENLFGVQQALTLSLMGNFGQAKELIKDLGVETNEVASNYYSMFERANEQVKKHIDLTETNIKKEKEANEEARKRAEEEERKAKAAERAAKAAERAAKAEKERIRLLNEALKFGDDDIKQNEAKSQLEQKLFNARASDLEKEIMRIEEKYQKEQESLQELALLSGDVATANQIADELAMERQKEIAELQNETNQKAIEKSKEIAMASASSLASVFDEAGALVEAFAGESKEAQKRAFYAQKSLSIASIIMKTAEAVMAAQLLPPPFNVIQAATVGALGAAQIAKTAAQQPPSMHMGGIAPDETTARVLKGEAILSRSAVNAMGGEEGIKQIEQGKRQKDQTVVIIQPFKHFGRFAKELGYTKPRTTGIGGY